MPKVYKAVIENTSNGVWLLKFEIRRNIKMAKSNGILKATVKSNKAVKPVVKPVVKSVAKTSLIKTILNLVTKKQGFYTKAKIRVATKATPSDVKAAVHAMWGKQITKKRKNGSYVGAYFLKIAKQ